MATKKILLKVAPTTGDPVKGTVEETATYHGGTPQIDLDVDMRDKLAELVGKGNALLPDDKAGIYGRLTALMGKDKAQKIMNHAYIFNQRPDVQKLPLEDKLKAFYTIGSNDPDVAKIMARSKSLGYGVVPGFRGSNSSLNQELQGLNAAPPGSTGNTEIPQRVMLKINK